MSAGKPSPESLCPPPRIVCEFSSDEEEVRIVLCRGCVLRVVVKLFCLKTHLQPSYDIVAMYVP